MPVSYLELENFKSYAGLQRIGPFRDFTCIIGPNGAGKSNIMDAIAFLFGVQSRDLRSSQMKDLIFRPPGGLRNDDDGDDDDNDEDGDGDADDERNAPAKRKSQKSKIATTTTTTTKLKATATLVYHDDEQDREYRFSRSVSPSGVGEYRVDGQVVSFADYEKELGTIGVLLKARNFLVFQGDVESIARKTPKELVEMLEQISTSAELRGPYDDAQKSKDEAEQATIFAYNKQKGFKSERRLLKDQKEEAQRFHQLLERRSSLQTDMYLWQLYHIHMDMKEREKVATELSDELEVLIEDEKIAVQSLKDAKKAASVARRETVTIDKKRIQFASEVARLEPSIIQTTEEIKSLSKKVESDEKNLDRLRRDVKRHEMTLTEIQGEISEYRDSAKKLEQDYEETKQSAAASQASVVLTQEQEEEFERVKEAAAAASDQPRRALHALNRRLDSARAASSIAAQEHHQLEARRQETSSQIQDFSERKTKLTKV